MIVQQFYDMAVNWNATCPYNHAATYLYRISTRKDCFDCSDISAECLQKAADGDCLFYTCFDERHPCELNNWALSYGWRFCKRYDQMYDTFTQEVSAQLQCDDVTSIMFTCRR